MKKEYKKTDLSVDHIRKYLEVGPIVLVSSSYRNKNNMMTMGWYTVMEFSPSLVGCMITSGNHSYHMIEKSRECVINLPTADLLDKIIGIGNTTGSKVDKFKKFKLTAQKAVHVKAPLIKECFANFECKVVDKRLLPAYNFFILEVVKAHVATAPNYPKTVHYRGEGIFMISGKHIACPEKFKPENL